MSEANLCLKQAGSVRRWAATVAGLIVATTPLAAHAQFGNSMASTAPVAPPSPPPSLRSDQIALLMETLTDASDQGFSKGEFMPSGLDALLRSASQSDRIRGAILLKSAILSYARAQHGGRLPTGQFQKNWGMRPGPYDPEAEFNFALTNDKLPQWLAALPPPFDRYRGCRRPSSSTAPSPTRAAGARWRKVRPSASAPADRG